jgi:hypothetical protein
MFSSSLPRRLLLAAFNLTTFIWIGSVSAGDLNPAAIAIKMPKDIKWVESPAAGSALAILVGDPDKPGFYAVLTKWHAGHMSRPHFHANNRYITVLSGTWWVGTGTKYNPDGTTPVPTGSFVTHFGKQIHYDGAKDGDVVLQIMGEGPATATNAEVK